MKCRYIWRNWRRNKGKMIRRRHTKKNWDGHFYIQACSYIQTCLTHKCAFTQRLYHTHTLSHTDVIHKHFYTHTQRDAFTNNFAHNPFYSRCFYIQTDTFAHTTLSHANAFTHISFYAPHKHFYTNAFTQRPFYIHTHPFHTQTRLLSNASQGMPLRTFVWLGNATSTL